jgi:hypothetical protein
MVSLMTSSWYTKEEYPLRMAIWHAGDIASNIFPGLLAAGVLMNMDNVAGLHTWQWFVLLEDITIHPIGGFLKRYLTGNTGILSVAIAIISFRGIPDFLHNTVTWFPAPGEGEMAQYRMVMSSGGHSEDEGGAGVGISLAIRDLSL